MEKKEPMKSDDLNKKLNNNIEKYGYKYTFENDKKEEKSEETYRTEIRRQRDKILYTGGFRRLQDKTQVMPSNVSGDHRTRLTHTLEVEQIAVSIANALELNPDLISAIALGHDIGHTPFGHAAERKLNELLEDYGGFHHSIQSVKYLREKYGEKIEPEIYEGILLHDSDMYEIDKEEAGKQLKFLKEDNIFEQYFKQFPSTLEAQVVIWADKIAYITHDLEDFLYSQIYVNAIKTNSKIEDELCNILNLLIKDKEEKTISKIEEFETRDLIRNIITNLIENSCEEINKLGYFEQKDVKELTNKRRKEDSNNKKKEYLNSLIINFKNDYRESYYKLRKFLDENYIMSPEVQRSDEKAKVVVEWLFNKFSENYRLMPLDIRKSIDNTIISECKKDFELNKICEKLKDDLKGIDQIEGEIKSLDNESNEKILKEFQSLKEEVVVRKVADYIATMTDTFAESLYRNLIGSKVEFVL